MLLYNKNTNKIEGITQITDKNGVTHLVKNIMVEELNENGFYAVEDKDSTKKDGRYYVNTKVKALVDNAYVISYTNVEKDLVTVQNLLLDDVTTVASDKYKTVVGGYSAEEMAEWTALENDAKACIEGGVPSIYIEGRAETVGVTAIQYSTALLADSSSFRNASMYITNMRAKIKKDINSFTTVEECILYEATPYDYIVTEEDVANDIAGTLVVGGVIPRVRNNCKDW